MLTPFRIVALGCALVTSSSWAASQATCREYVKAVERVSKEELSADVRRRQNRECLKDSNTEVKQAIACLDASKSEADRARCIK